MTETWYAIQVTPHGADDWYASGDQTYDTVEAARLAMRATYIPGYDFRIVKKTLAEEVVS